MSLFQAHREGQTSWGEVKLVGTKRETSLESRVSNISWGGRDIVWTRQTQEELELPGRGVQGAGKRGQAVRVIFDRARASAARRGAGDPVVNVPEAERWN